MKKIDLFVPGRLCLFGEHSDWAGGYRRMDVNIPIGYCIVVGTNQGIYGTAKPHPGKFIMTSTLPDSRVVGPHEFNMDEQELRSAAQYGGFYSYCAGVACWVLRNHHVEGLEINNTRMDLPIRKGLSSSAAINVLVARAFNRIYDLKLTRRGEMELAYQGEIMTPSRCGRMDQACAYGDIPVLLTFDGDHMEIEELHPAKPIYMVVVDLKKGKNTMKILADLNACYPATPGKIAEDVRHALGPLNQEMVFQAKEAIRAGDSRKIGMLMTEAQAFFDEFIMPACPSELASPKLHEVLTYPAIQELIWGGKGVGSQGDGSAQLVARGPQEQKALMELLERELDVACLALIIRARQPDEGQIGENS